MCALDMQESAFDIRSLTMGHKEKWAEQKKKEEKEKMKKEREERRLKELAEKKEREQKYELNSLLQTLNKDLDKVVKAKDSISFWCFFNTILNTIQEFHSFIQETNSILPIQNIVVDIINAMTQNSFVKINLHGDKWEVEQFKKYEGKLKEVMKSLGMDPKILECQIEMDIDDDIDKAKELDGKLNGSRRDIHRNRWTDEGDEDLQMALAMSLEDF